MSRFSSRWRASAGSIVLGALAVALAADGWRRWPDVLVDFGHELYVPWRILEGDVLYRDLAFLYGPLSQYVNALWFSLFGVSLSTLIWVNLALVAGFALLVRSTVRRACDEWTAALATAAFLGLSAFAQLVPIGNYNFVTPYSHEATHGTFLAFAMIAGLARGVSGTGLAPAVLAGSCLGLALLTRAEIGLAALVTAAFALVVLVARPDTAPSWRGRRLAAFGAAAALPQLVAAVAFSGAMPSGTALRAAAGAWSTLLGTEVRRNPFFVVGMGMEAPASNFERLVESGVVTVAFLVLVATLDWLATRRGGTGKVPGAATAVAVVVTTTAFPALVAWGEVARILPLVSATAAVALLVLAFTRTGRRVPVDRLLPLLSIAIFSFVLAGKMLLNARLHHYGFYLALPGTLLLVCLLVWAVPRLLHLGFGGGVFFRWTASSLVIAAVLFHVRVSHSYYREKNFPVGEGSDLLVTYDPRLDPRGPAVVRTLEILERGTGSTDTLAVFPEGVLLNYLSRRRNPTPYTTLMPTEIAAFGEDAVVRALDAHPPDLVALVHKDTSEFGRGFFGKDPLYGLRIMGWLKNEYEAFERVDAEPFVDDRFGIVLLKRTAVQTR